jgi:predicted ferric reductase
MSEQIWWYVARSGGMVALVMATASMVWGLLLSTKMLAGKPRPAWLLDLHRFLGAATVVFTAIHVLGLWLDSFVQFGLSDLFVPFASAWKPGAVAWGIVSMYLLLAIQGSSMLMKKIPRRWWRGIHLTSFAMFISGVIHGITAGTDSGHPAAVGGAVTSIALVVFLTIYRIATSRTQRVTPSVIRAGG